MGTAGLKIQAIRKLRDLVLSGDQRAINLQRRILDEAGANQTERINPEVKKQLVIDALRRMGATIVESEGDDG